MNWHRLADFLRYIYRLAGLKLIYALCFMLIASLMEGLSILLIIPLLYLIGANDLVSIGIPFFSGAKITLQLHHVLAALVALVVAQSMFQRFKNIYLTELAQDLSTKIRLGLFGSMAQARWEFISRHRTSDLNQLVNADIDKSQGAAQNLLSLIQALVLLLVYLCISWFVSPVMTLVAFVLGLLVLAVLAPVRKRASRQGAAMMSNRRQQYRTVTEFLTGLKVAKSYNAETGYVSQLGDTLTVMRGDLLGYMRVSTLTAVVSQISTAIAVAVFVLVGLGEFDLPIATLALFILLFVRIAPRFHAIQTHYQDVLLNLPAVTAIQNLRAECDAQREPSSSEGGREAPLLARTVAFNAVSFDYRSGDDRHRILTDMSFELPAHRITALIGPSGSGKSTIADLLIGLLRPTAGHLLIDGQELADDQSKSWRAQVAYVPQDVFLLHDSIGANLLLGAPKASENMMWDALAKANAADFVARLPMKLATVVGERGTRLSGGERQRIALARALLSSPRLLILDEATSALDWENQRLIAGAIEALRGSLTVVTIAHRPSMIAFADWVVAIENGRVVETGPYGELVGRPGSTLAKLLAGEGADE